MRKTAFSAIGVARMPAFPFSANDNVPEQKTCAAPVESDVKLILVNRSTVFSCQVFAYRAFFLGNRFARFLCILYYNTLCRSKLACSQKYCGFFGLFFDVHHSYYLYIYI